MVTPAAGKPTPEVAKAQRYLAKVDPVLGAHMLLSGPCSLGLDVGRESNFETLAREIVFQQLAGKAAASIWLRVRALVKGRFTAAAVLNFSEADLRGAGLSNNKYLSIVDLARHVADRRLLFAKFSTYDDEEIIEHLTMVRGIGRWTAQMFMMFKLVRLDVWPTGDLGVRNGYRLLYGHQEMPSVKEFEVAGDVYAPYRSVAAWFMWRVTDTVTAD